LNKGSFIGKEALEKQLKKGVPHRFITFEVHGVTDADPLGNEPLFDCKGTLVGRATAGYYGHALKQELGLRLRQAGIRQGGRRARDRNSRGTQSARRFSWIRPMIPRTRI
jgi:glycine cleavage system aminomethyltransferase T